MTTTDPVPVVVIIDGVPYECTGYWDDAGRMEHSGITCPIHEDETSPAYVEDGLRRQPQPNGAQHG